MVVALLVWVTFLAGGVYPAVWMPAAVATLAAGVARASPNRTRPRVAGVRSRAHCRGARNDRAGHPAASRYIGACRSACDPPARRLVAACLAFLSHTGQPRTGRHPGRARDLWCGGAAVLDVPADLRGGRHRPYRARHCRHRSDCLDGGHHAIRRKPAAAVRFLAASRRGGAPLRPLRQSQSLRHLDDHGVPAGVWLSSGARAGASRAPAHGAAHRGRRQAARIDSHLACRLGVPDDARGDDFRVAVRRDRPDHCAGRQRAVVKRALRPSYAALDDLPGRAAHSGRRVVRQLRRAVRSSGSDGAGHASRARPARASGATRNGWLRTSLSPAPAPAPSAPPSVPIRQRSPASR